MFLLTVCKICNREQNPQDDEQIGSVYGTSSLIATDGPQRKKKITDTSQGTLLPPSKTAGSPSPPSGPGFSGRRGPPAVSRSNKKSKREVYTALQK